jgi:outer membrane protein
MHRHVALVAFMLVVLLLGGCATSAIVMAPDSPDRPWTPATGPDGEIIAGEPPPPGQPENNTYVLPSNRELENTPPPRFDIERRRAYSLPELIDIAESNNPITRNAWNDARSVALAAGIVESTFLPMVSAGIVDGNQWFHNVTSLGSNDVTLRGNVEVLAVQWLLFDFGERAALLDVAKQASVISNIAFTAAHQQVIYSVSLAFYADAAARAHLASAAKSLRDAQAVQAAAEDRYRRGIGTVVEVAQTRQATAEARLARVQAQGAAENSYLALITAIGISPTTQLKIADISRRKLTSSMTVPIDRFVSAALARRPDVLTGYATLQASLANLRAAQAAFLPKIFFSGNGTRLSGSLGISAIPGVGAIPGGGGQQLPIVNLPQNLPPTLETQYGTTALIGATVPLYDGGLRAALLEQANDKIDKAGTSLVQIRNEAIRQIVVASNTLKTSLSAYTASMALTTAAQTTFNSALAAYRNGVGSVSDATTAERQLLAAKNSATDAYSTALSSAASLALAAGALGGPPP